MEDIWDSFGRWDYYARLTDIRAIKTAISGKGVWVPNYVSNQTSYAMRFASEESRQTSGNPTSSAVDFGCGLGRNSSIVRNFFPRSIGFDLPSMLSKLEEFSGSSAKAYDGLYSDAEELVSNENFCAIYDSVAFQHIANREFVSDLIGKFMNNVNLKTFVSLCFHGGARASYRDVLLEKGWTIWFEEVDNMSFIGTPHLITVYRR